MSRARAELAARGVDVALRRVDAALDALPPELRGARPKPAPYVRSDAYKRFVRTHACICCGVRADVEADHVGPRGVGQKTDDLRCVPVCRPCHRFRTDNGYLPLDGTYTAQRHQARAERVVVRRLEWRTRLIVAEAQVRLLVAWYKGGGK